MVVSAEQAHQFQMAIAFNPMACQYLPHGQRDTADQHSGNQDGDGRGENSRYTAAAVDGGHPATQ